ncbi:MAG: hypothetical protein U0746_18765 [Gemmataceae bacterium]
MTGASARLFGTALARALEIAAVEMIAPLVAGGTTVSGSPTDGLGVNFKRGQVGGADYFAVVARGKA